MKKFIAVLLSIISILFLVYAANLLISPQGPSLLIPTALLLFYLLFGWIGFYLINKIRFLPEIYLLISSFAYFMIFYKTGIYHLSAIGTVDACILFCCNIFLLLTNKKGKKRPLFLIVGGIAAALLVAVTFIFLFLLSLIIFPNEGVSNIAAFLFFL